MINPSDVIDAINARQGSYLGERLEAHIIHGLKTEDHRRVAALYQKPTSREEIVGMVKMALWMSQRNYTPRRY